MRLALPVVLCCASFAHAAPTRQTHTEPHPGIVYETWRDTGAVPIDVFLIRIDLTSSEIQMIATPESGKGHRTTFFAAQGDPAAVAINGGAFVPNGYLPRGLAIGDGATWSNTADDDHLAVLHLHREGEHTVAAIAPPEDTTTLAMLPMGTEGAVSGLMLVRASNVAGPFDCTDSVAIPCMRAPRTAVGISADGHTLVAAVVDGWQASSHGMTADEIATFIRARGAGDAMLLDSGSSSTLVVDAAIANHPSDGVERIVANHLGWRYGQLPAGELTGAICRDLISNCTNLNDLSKRITGATVTLDDGRSVVTPSSGCAGGTPATCGSYDFGGVTPRLACVTVKKDGFRTAKKCQQVSSTNPPTYNSVVLVEGTDPPDAGVPTDASEDPVDGGNPGVTNDGGTTPGGNDPGGCCETGRSRPAFPGMLLAAFTGWFLRRRRGTTGPAQ